MKINKGTNNQSEIRTIEHIKAQSIKHKNTCTYEQEFQLISFRIEVAQKEVDPLMVDPLAAKLYQLSCLVRPKRFTFE